MFRKCDFTETIALHKSETVQRLIITLSSSTETGDGRLCSGTVDLFKFYASARSHAIGSHLTHKISASRISPKFSLNTLSL